MNLRIKTPDQLRKEAKAKMASWKARKKREKLEGKKPEPEPVVKAKKIQKKKLTEEEQFILNRKLWNATKEGDLEKVKDLIEQGADVNFEDIGHTPLMHACRIGEVEMFELLMNNGAEPTIDIIQNVVHIVAYVDDIKFSEPVENKRMIDSLERHGWII